MVDKRKKQTPKEVEDARLAAESKGKLPRSTSTEPNWESPRTPQPVDAITPANQKQNALKRAQEIAGYGAPPEVLAAVIIAQAFDRLGDKLTEAAAISQYKRGS